MIHKIFTIYDEKAKAYLPPFFLPESGQAIRSFSNCINSNDHQFSKNPEDYTLFTLGTFDDNSSILEPYALKSLGNGVQFINTPDQDPPDNETKIGNDAPILTGAGSGNSA